MAESKNDYASPDLLRLKESLLEKATHYQELDLDQWKEINEYARHWETLMFESAKNYFTIVTLALGATGAVLTWASIPRPTQRLVIATLIVAAFLLSVLALVSAISQRRYLKGLYMRRRELEDRVLGLTLRHHVSGSGWTPTALMGGFGVAIGVSILLFASSVQDPSPGLLRGARLPGANLDAVVGLTQADLEGACGDSTSKLPPGLTIQTCQPQAPSSREPIVPKRP